MIRDLHSQGYSFREIARVTGLGYGTVRRAYHGLAPLGAEAAHEQPKEPPTKQTKAKSGSKAKPKRRTRGAKSAAA